MSAGEHFRFHDGAVTELVKVDQVNAAAPFTHFRASAVTAAVPQTEAARTAHRITSAGCGRAARRERGSCQPAAKQTLEGDGTGAGPVSPPGRTRSSLLSAQRHLRPGGGAPWQRSLGPRVRGSVGAPCSLISRPSWPGSVRRGGGGRERGPSR